jgi:hypothetical protein
MPVTRDLSNGKRIVLELYLYLVQNTFKVTQLSVKDVTSR